MGTVWNPRGCHCANSNRNGGCLTYWCGERAARHISQIPVGRFGRPDEVAAACLFLASDAAGMISGTTVMLDGGYTIRLKGEVL